ncbi:hypothetical protein JCM19241_5557 [Vibrio ishigakensis]|uniref:Uncharacterized protein n=1 Tax=Vibrio ishigakensis TaxID=1481914 RepID=A0A0B8Q6Z2_9VIBR|nr:hypothetical protein JCM19241_5557 [Vibrio ishigakensis]
MVYYTTRTITTGNQDSTFKMVGEQGFAEQGLATCIDNDFIGPVWMNAPVRIMNG